MIPPEHEAQLRELVQVFLAENRHINLSAFRDEDSCWHGNVLDSLAAVAILRESAQRDSPRRIIDLGTGGGFPLLPLAIFFPDDLFTGLDATRKKILAVSRIVAKLGLTNVELFASRAEEAGHQREQREQYEMVTARAIAPLSTLLEYGSPFARVGGLIIIWKSLNIDEEIRRSTHSAELMNCSLERSEQYDLGEGWGKRQLLIYRKTAPLPERFPRAVGVPGKQPL